VSVDAGIFPPPRDRQHPFDPPPEIQRRQREEPVSRVRIWTGDEAWLITRYEDGRAVLSDPRFSANPWRPGFPEKSIAYAETLGKDRNIRALDNPEHGPMKRMIIGDFTVKRVEQLRPRIEQVVNDLLEDMIKQGPPLDLVAAFSFAVPTTVICELLGVPFADRDYFGERSKAIMAAKTAELASAAGAELNTYIDHLVDLRTTEPGDDLISRLVHEQMLPGHLDRREVISLGRIMLAAGHETTANGITMSVMVLLQHPGQLDEIKGETSQEFIANAVDELFRYTSVVHTGRRRVAIEDVEVRGTLIRAGEGVIVLNSAMDRDDTVFSEPDILDLRRKNARENITFGYGIHQCPGQYLSRVELQIVHSNLWKRLPSLRLAVPEDKVEFFEDGSVYSIPSLPVAW
jgi:hypothetical protein